MGKIKELFKKALPYYEPIEDKFGNTVEIKRQGWICDCIECFYNMTKNYHDQSIETMGFEQALYLAEKRRAMEEMDKTVTPIIQEARDPITKEPIIRKIFKNV